MSDSEVRSLDQAGGDRSSLFLFLEEAGAQMRSLDKEDGDRSFLFLFDFLEEVGAEMDREGDLDLEMDLVRLGLPILDNGVPL